MCKRERQLCISFAALLVDSMNKKVQQPRTDHAAILARDAIRNLLGSRVSCTLSDGRQTVGVLVCVDRLKNMVLTDCWETRTIVSTDYNPDKTNVVKTLAKRHLQQAMVPGANLVKVEVENLIYEQKIAPILKK